MVRLPVFAAVVDAPSFFDRVQRRQQGRRRQRGLNLCGRVEIGRLVGVSQRRRFIKPAGAYRPYRRVGFHCLQCCTQVRRPVAEV